ncbi:hypothetical protein QBC38DRAFT_443171 [Podospora fimiseda]|uniref:Mid2 domain-containing protein n=1 Tax=Podospora fimiseda TaxID=252190 RepID=A0AAN7BRE9_9PEZI|nr:hypothetical protein QBC38DRAFT_443171 [Podospora fimiseda]
MKPLHLLPFLLLLPSTSAQTISLPPNFKGYYTVSSNGPIYTETCPPSSTLSTSGAYARCCPTSNTKSACNFRTGCDSRNSRVEYQWDGPKYCASGYHCVTTTIHDSWPYGWNRWIDYACGSGDINVDLYRWFSTSSTITTTTTITATRITRTTTSTGGSVVKTGVSDENQVKEVKKEKIPIGTIIGAVVGGVVVLGLILGGIGLLMLRIRGRDREDKGVREPFIGAQQAYVVQTGSQQGAFGYPGAGMAGGKVVGVQVRVGER